MAYTAQYRAFASRNGLTCQQLAPYWAKARGTANAKFPNDIGGKEYWKYVWAAMKGMLFDIS